MNRSFAHVVALLLSMLLTSCVNDGEANANVAFSTIGEYVFNRITNQRMEVIRTSNELNAFWFDLTGEMGSIASAPYVDFSRDEVIAVVAPQATYGVIITNIEIRDGKTIVYSTINVCLSVCPPVVVQPYHVVSLPRTQSFLVDFVFSVRDIASVL